MPVELLFSPWGGVFWMVAIIVALTFHEFCHALVAYSLGDSTPKNEGRVTLFPFPHLDPLGFALLLFFGVGWARPVRFEAANLRLKTFGSTLVALAGPLANVFLLSCTIVIAQLIGAETLAASVNLTALFSALIIINSLLAAVNLIPLPPFDGSKLLLDLLVDLHLEKLRTGLAQYGQYILIVLLLLDNLVGPGILQGAISWLTDWALDLII